MTSWWWEVVRVREADGWQPGSDGYQSRLGRMMERIIGRERLDNFFFPERCPWRTSGLHEQCARAKGHKGSCLTTFERTNTQTGKTHMCPQWWYGINYETTRP